MKPSKRILSFPPGLLFATGLALAQSSELEVARLVRGLPSLDQDRVAFDEPGDGALWAVGATYKVRFGMDGTTYYPRLGPNAPRNFPLELSLREVEVGGAALDVEPVQPTRTGDAVSFRRAAIEERYELAPASLEQVFVFHEPLPAGELVIRVAAQTDLAKRAEEGRLVFEHTLGHVGYTQAFAFDERGVSLPLETKFDGGDIEIRVPADLVASAVYPLTIDPVITTVSLNNVIGTEGSPDVAYDASFDRYLAVWEVAFSASDVDIRAQAIDASGNPDPNPEWIDSTDTCWANPAVANSNDDDRFLVVAQVGTGDREIWGRTVAAADMANPLGPQFEIAGHLGLTWDKANPDVGGDSRINDSGGTRFLVVYEQQNPIDASDRDIVRRTVTAEFTPSVSSTVFVHDTDDMLTNPAVSKTNGRLQNDQNWIVVWERDGGPTLQDLYTAEVDPNGTIAVPATGYGTALSEYNPAVSTPVYGDNGREYLVAFQSDSGSGDADIWVMRRRTGGIGLSITNLTTLEGNPNAANRQYEPAVESDGCKFIVAYSEDIAMFSSAVYATVLAQVPSPPWSFEVQENRALLGSGGVNSGVALASVRGAGSDAPPHVMAVWSYFNLLGGTGVEGALFALPGPPNDCCVYPENITGTGIFDFDNTNASEEGPDAVLCSFSKDVWFSWTPAAPGLYSISTCGLASLDTALAVFAASGCPVGPPLACDDDTCGAQSQVVFSASPAQEYRIAIGSASASAEGAGQFQIRRISDGGLGVTYCTSAPNSVSASGASITANGSTSVAANDLILSATPLPPNVPGIFYFGVATNLQPFGDGFRCVGGPTFRLPFTFASGGGSATFMIDNTTPPATNLGAGLTRYFQYWHRDPSGPGGSGFNLSNGLELTFVP